MGNTSLRKRYSPEQKAQMVLQVLKEELSLAQIASERGVHPTQLRQWKTQAVDRLPLVFQDGRSSVRELQVEHERERTELYTEIGRLTTQLSWLKKKSGLEL